MKYIDIHCHLNHDDFNLDLQNAISRAKENEVGMIIVGDNLSSSEKAVKIAEENENIWAVVGLHPTEITKEEFDFDKYFRLAQNPKVVAIGECGLEYFKDGFKSREAQLQVFEKHIHLANKVRKPLMLHIRSGMKSEENAYKDAIEMLKKHAEVHGDVHFFSGSSEEAHHFIELGFRLSFTGVITFARNYDEVIKNIPLNMIMSETDAPFVAPIPHRGERCEPSYVIEVVKKIAEIKGETVEKTAKHLIDNAEKLFGIANLH